jgi:site-specific recombinase XerD
MSTVTYLNTYQSNNADLLTLRGNFTDKFLATYKSEDTQRGYKHDILEFFNVTNTSQITLSMVQSISATQTLIYLQDIVAKGNERSTVNRKMCAMKSLLDYVNFHGLSCGIKVENIFANPFLKKSIENQANKVNHEIDTFKPWEIELILKVCKEKARIPQHYVVLKLLFNSMARREEMVNIMPEDIFQTTNNSGEIEYGLKLRITKGRKERSIYISHEIKALLDSVTFAPGCPIINYTADNICKILNKYCKLAGIQKTQISPHIARHSGMTIANDRGAEIKDIQNTAGHSSEKTTQGYIHDSKKFEKCATRYLNF